MSKEDRGRMESLQMALMFVHGLFILSVAPTLSCGVGGGLAAGSLSLQAHTVPSALLMVVRSHGVLPKQTLRGTITYLLIWL